MPCLAVGKRRPLCAQLCENRSSRGEPALSSLLVYRTLLAEVICQLSLTRQLIWNCWCKNTFSFIKLGSIKVVPVKVSTPAGLHSFSRSAYSIHEALERVLRHLHLYGMLFVSVWLAYTLQASGAPLVADVAAERATDAKESLASPSNASRHRLHISERYLSLQSRAVAKGSTRAAKTKWKGVSDAEVRLASPHITLNNVHQQSVRKGSLCPVCWLKANSDQGDLDSACCYYYGFQ